ncbi:coagulation factor V [Leptodactylus fuscus]|uniref:coagulation factor V n=1 Tax=Leptodactylus fuscus TaxID=238119 RepID=UPI003F4EF2A0
MEPHMHHPGPLVVLLLLLGALAHITPCVTALDREYYVAAVITDWDYSNGQADSSEYVFKKIIYREYEEGFRKAKTASELSGILGPTLRAEVGNTLKVHFKNMASKPLTIHPQGISFGKLSEGVKYADGTSSLEKLDDFVLPGEIYTYSWDITEDMGPKEADPDCLTSSYYSMENPVQDVNSGLIGALLICKKGSLNDDGTQKNFNKDYVLMFGVFDESKSRQTFSATKESPLMYTVNGYVKGALPAFTACANDRISWHILGLSSKPEFFSIHFFQHSLEQNHHKVSVISLASMASTTANMTVSQTGTWNISSLVEKHLEAGMHGHLKVESCANTEHRTHRTSIFQTRYIQKWDYYIAAVEVNWDYASGTSEKSERTYCHHPFKKVVYKQYTDSTFTTTVDNTRELGLIGPVIRAQVKETIMVVFKNMGSQPHNIYPHGVSLQKFFKGYVPDLKGEEAQNSTVMPGETATYFWTILDSDQPTNYDPQCLTRIYHSTVNIEKDLASGLLGTLLICKAMALNTRGLQEKADEEQVLMFSVFDENKSWYYDHNKPKACNKVLNKDSKSLYNSYVINSINGNSYENAILGFCHSHVVQWHVSNVGVQDETITLQLSGLIFRYKQGNGDMVTLFPMTAESISIEMSNQGVWTFGNYNSKVTTLRFRNAKCVHEEDYYPDEGFSFDYPEVRSDLGEDSEELEFTNEDIDYNEKMAALFNIRSLKNSSRAIYEGVNLTAIALEDILESSAENVNISANSTKGNEDFNEEDFLKEDVIEYVSKNDTFLNTNERENLSEKNVSQNVLQDQYDNVNQTEELDSWIPNNTTDLESEPNIILPTNSTLYVQKSSVEEDDRKSIEMQSDGSDIAESRNIDNRYIYYDDYGEDLSSNERNDELQNSITDSQGPQATDIQKSDDKVFLLERPENVTESPKLDNVTNQVTQFTEQSDVKTQVISTSNNKTDDSIDGVNQVPARPSPSAIPTNLHGVTTTTSTQDSAPVQTHTTTTVSSHNRVHDFYDSELAEMFDAHILGNIIESIFHQETSEETYTVENDILISNETVENNLEELENQSFTTASNMTEEKPAENKKVYYKRMSRFQINENNKQKAVAMNLKKKKRAGKVKGKRTAVNNDQSNVRGYNKNGTLNDEHAALNNSLHNGIKNGTFTPRGLGPRGHNPSSLRPRGNNREISIGIFRAKEGDYAEYDHDANFLIDDEKPKPKYITYEEPYVIQTEDDVNRYTNPDRIVENFLRTSKGTKRTYYIAAVEVDWDYAGGSRRNQVNEKPIDEATQTMYKKVIFRQYLDSTFSKPDVEGEYEEHLGLLGPVIRAEVEDVIQVTFKNLASRPYSIHAHGVSYEKSSEGYGYDDETPDWLKKDDVVQPQESYVYVWYATKQSAPESDGSACKTWAYHSGVDLEKDIHSGLIGPLIICRPGTLDKQTNRPLDAREFVLLFMTFEEEKSWHFNKNKKCTDVAEKSSNGMTCHTFHAINGITYNLQGFNMYQNELVRWHMLNMGGPKDIHVVNFHGQTMKERIQTEYTHPAYTLMPGTFATVEMNPARAGVWLLDTEVAEYQQAGMQTLFNVAEEGCNFPLGMASRTISDDQITASHYIDQWEPKLARLNNVGAYNAWSAHLNKSSLPWIQVDLQKVFLISGIQTQGARKYLTQYYIKEFFIAYSKDRRKWNVFKGNSTATHMIFEGNSDSSSIKENQFEPPIAARYIRLFPTKYSNQPALRMELLGCETQGCSAPLGMENYNIKDMQITASSHKSTWFSSPWLPSLARLNMAGSVNAWQAKSNNNQQWLQIDFLVKKRITGIMTQGARSFTYDLYVNSYSVQYSDNGKTWKSYMDSSTSMEKIFKGNSNSFGRVKNEFNPPIFSRYIRIIPKSWNESIVMRLEVYGCDM